MNEEIEYPQCFIIRENTSEDAIWFVRIMNESEDLELHHHQTDYLNSRFTVEVTTLAEAETYHAFDIAPIGTSNEFIEWIESEIIKDVKNVGNIITGTKNLSKDEYPSYYLVLVKSSKTDPDAVCVFPIKSKEQNLEMPISWWEKFSEVLYLKELTYSSFEECIAVKRVFEYNTKELLERVERLTKKGA